MKHSEILRKAKRYIWNGKNQDDVNKDQFICWALERVSDLDEVDTKVRQIRQEIQKRMGDELTIESWLNRWGYIPANWYPEFQVKIQKYRKAWMNQLIKEYERIGQ